MAISHARKVQQAQRAAKASIHALREQLDEAVVEITEGVLSHDLALRLDRSGERVRIAIADLGRLL